MVLVFGTIIISLVILICPPYLMGGGGGGGGWYPRAQGLLATRQSVEYSTILNIESIASMFTASHCLGYQLLETFGYLIFYSEYMYIFLQCNFFL